MKIKGSEVESTPLAYVEITDKVGKNGRTVAWFGLYWTLRRGTYGYQVCWEGSTAENEWFEGKTGGCGYGKVAHALELLEEAFKRGDSIIDELNEWFEGKTGGCGYGKVAHALQHCLREILGKTPYSCRYAIETVLRGHHTGGNHYRLSMRQLRKALRELH